MAFTEVTKTVGIPAGTMKHDGAGRKEICVVNGGA